MLKNPSFEGPWYHPGNISELQIPDSWAWWHANETITNPYDTAPHSRFVRPEVRVLPREQIPEHEQLLFLLDGDQCLKAFKGSGSIFFSLAQDINLEAGRYRLTVKVYPDVVSRYDGGKVFADDPNAALIRFRINDDYGVLQPINPVWLDERDINRLQTVTHEFDAEGMTTVRIYFMLPFPLPQNGVFCDDWSLEVVDEPDPPPDPPTCNHRGLPRVQYERTVVLLPPNAGLELVRTVTDAAYVYRSTVGSSADDAGVADLDKRVVVAVNPSGWPTDLESFFKQFYPGVEYYAVTGTNDYQLRGRILAGILRGRGVKLGYPTTHQPAKITDEFGVWRPGNETTNGYHHNGLDLASSYSSHGDKVLAAYDGKVVVSGRLAAESWFGYQVRIKSVLPDGKEMYVRYAHLVKDSQTVGLGNTVEAGQVIGLPDSTGNSTGDHLHIDVKIGDDYYDPAMLIDWETLPDVEPDPQPTDTTLEMGMHDDGGGDWMVEN